jgi:hypothetical protein
LDHASIINPPPEEVEIEFVKFLVVSYGDTSMVCVCASGTMCAHGSFNTMYRRPLFKIPKDKIPGDLDLSRHIIWNANDGRFVEISNKVKISKDLENARNLDADSGSLKISSKKIEISEDL